ncbi:MAG: hypothetical protein BRC47_08380 [Cyanobacteria bacterium QS_7_48_42]|jgi:hypothetical protein|nr:MAG: hypothetical protein BRC35_04870 [Cyanobacteria bacterium QH_10_48_56]PSO64016.1 MAG: hypothetical protein BRC39_03405 [Cyanobacteria bacterium QH_7_48_89]PSO65009.1 MAG: hypothetical protein BRC36_04815 [Cyanobacteria bacterium QH_2_48_84]PSO66030.1 MAG: hypothetical protein BRC38_06925 [Cyanobacteria bacterium QH_6_48_35]PSO68902.1 MAG: hypothetical protein BRC42_12770 [Cyanobacteria bacterium QS_1_48_34]PSO76027.1 MAG: hypothetical protein BRC44_17305 [Cyanobacteria bacterium QS_4_4
MTASDEFKAQLQAGKITDALTLALSEAIELEITTWVSTDESDNQSDEKPTSGHCLRTRMNIVDGNVDNEVGSEYFGSGPYAELQNFHLEQVKEGRQIVQKNLESLQQMFAVLSKMRSYLSEGSNHNSQEKPALSASEQQDYS